MKKLIQLIAILTITLSCRAQSPVYDILDYHENPPFGAYYKDVYNQLDSYEGTYIYTDANQMLKIVLQKKVLSANANHSQYEDLIIGEFQHIVNGVEKINTLNKLAINYQDQALHGIRGSYFLTGDSLGCTDCAPNEKRLAGSLKDNVAHTNAVIQLRKMTVGSQPAMKFSLYWELRVHADTDPPVKYPSIAPGDYIMIKQ